MAMHSTETSDVLLRVRGTVQGVGFRPFVLRIATRLGLRGWVRNDAQGVLVRATGEREAVSALIGRLLHDAPPAARVTAVESVPREKTTAFTGEGFEILTSDGNGAALETSPPPELALCAECRGELLDPKNRRHGYPFINCTQCGPRYSIIESLPYDRPATTMRSFPMCAACRREYHDPTDRRFHAQPNACPTCGPQLILTNGAGETLARREDALERTAQALRAGAIVAVKGVGGFHLMCDATNDASVAQLRKRKHRAEKPLAVMFRDIAQLHGFAEVSAEAEGILQSTIAPIVLVPRREKTALAPGIAPGNPWIGALLASTPLHVVLLETLAFPIVATSANLSEEPLCTDDAEARNRLAGMADLFLGHDRPIARPVDDSVVRLTSRGQPLLLRRARGYAPTPVQLPGQMSRTTLCVGAHMKNAVAVASGNRVVLSPHIGDLGNAVTHGAFLRTIDMLGTLHRSPFASVVHDKHPDYASTRHARKLGLPTIAVQHHLAHVLACLLENRQPPDAVLGICWDGTGYGEDGTIWGGEFILIERGVARHFARLRPFRLPGGEAAVRDPRRVALGLARDCDARRSGALGEKLGLPRAERELLGAMIERGVNSPICSSAGRLFDGVGALIGLGHHNSFEGQVPLAVEALAWLVRQTRVEPLPFAITSGGAGVACELDWRPAIDRLMRRPAVGSDQALAFHHGLAHSIAAMAHRAGVGTVALTGGCFQNALLHQLAFDALEASGFRVLVHRDLSPNDGSIAAGQALGALWNLTSVNPV